MDFAREPLERILGDMAPLMVEHYREIALFQDIPLEPDFEMFFKIEDAGGLRCFSARDGARLTGYAFFFIHPHPHFKRSLQAVQSLLWVSPDDRGLGMRFLRYCDDELKKDGVAVVYHAVTNRFDFSPMLERLGYQANERMYARRLN